jgi:hypothetical protein
MRSASALVRIQGIAVLDACVVVQVALRRSSAFNICYTAAIIHARRIMHVAVFSSGAFRRIHGIAIFHTVKTVHVAVWHGGAFRHIQGAACLDASIVVRVAILRGLALGRIEEFACLNARATVHGALGRVHAFFGGHGTAILDTKRPLRQAVASFCALLRALEVAAVFCARATMHMAVVRSLAFHSLHRAARLHAGAVPRVAVVRRLPALGCSKYLAFLHACVAVRVAMRHRFALFV